jgi:hypothetical protein
VNFKHDFCTFFVKKWLGFARKRAILLCMNPKYCQFILTAFLLSQLGSCEKAPVPNKSAKMAKSKASQMVQYEAVSGKMEMQMEGDESIEEVPKPPKPKLPPHPLVAPVMMNPPEPQFVLDKIREQVAKTLGVSPQAVDPDKPLVLQGFQMEQLYPMVDAAEKDLKVLFPDDIFSPDHFERLTLGQMADLASLPGSLQDREKDAELSKPQTPAELALSRVEKHKRRGKPLGDEDDSSDEESLTR